MISPNVVPFIYGHISLATFTANLEIFGNVSPLFLQCFYQYLHYILRCKSMNVCRIAPHHGIPPTPSLKKLKNFQSILA